MSAVAAPGPLRRHVMGLAVANPVGLAAGVDRHGECLAALEAAGFGFAELGTVTPRPEPGHNLGAAAVVTNLLARRPAVGQRRLRIGVSLGTNRDTPLERAADDYLAGLEQVWRHADYVVVNLSAPPARPLLEPRHEALLATLLAEVAAGRAALARRAGRRVPVAVKIGLDPALPELPPALGLVRRHGMDALIAAIGPGDRGVEAGPAADAATRAHAVGSLRRLTAYLGREMPVISVGGILTPADVRERLAAGAALVQIHRAFVDRGPPLIAAILDALAGAVPHRGW